MFIAGSSWLPDEEIFIRYFKEHPDWKLIIAPHVIGEDHLQQIEKLLDGRKVIRYTKVQSAEAPTSGLSPAEKLSKAVEGASVLIIDCFGLLSSIYHYGQVTYVGGGFGVGIHNVLEAAVWDVPVIFGPNNEKFQEAQELKAAGGGFDFQDYDDFKRLMDGFIAQPTRIQETGSKAGGYVKSKAGATPRILQAVGF